MYFQTIYKNVGDQEYATPKYAIYKDYFELKAFEKYTKKDSALTQ